MKPFFLFTMCAVLGAAVAEAAPGSEALSHPVPEPARVGESHSAVRDNPASTGNWLSIQREGEQASPHEQQATDVERELSYQRFLESYTHPIPEFFAQEAGGDISR